MPCKTPSSHYTASESIVREIHVTVGNKMNSFSKSINVKCFFRKVNNDTVVDKYLFAGMEYANRALSNILYLCPSGSAFLRCRQTLPEAACLIFCQPDQYMICKTLLSLRWSRASLHKTDSHPPKICSDNLWIPFLNFLLLSLIAQSGNIFICAIRI